MVLNFFSKFHLLLLLAPLHLPPTRPSFPQSLSFLSFQSNTSFFLSSCLSPLPLVAWSMIPIPPRSFHICFKLISFSSFRYVDTFHVFAPGLHHIQNLKFSKPPPLDNVISKNISYYFHQSEFPPPWPPGNWDQETTFFFLYARKMWKVWRNMWKICGRYEKICRKYVKNMWLICGKYEEICRQ